MEKQFSKKKTSKLITLITLVSFVLSPIAPALAGESVVVIPTEEKLIVVTEEKKEIVPIIETEPVRAELAKPVAVIDKKLPKASNSFRKSFNKKYEPLREKALKALKKNKC